MKFQLICALLPFLAFSSSGVQCAAVSQTTPNPDFGEALKMFLIAVRKIMPCGYADYKMPVLAPYRLDFYEFNFTNEYHSVVGHLSNIVLTGIDKYRILSETYNASANRTSFDFIFSDLHILGEYEMNLKANLAGFEYILPAKGLLDMRLVDFRLFGDVVFSQSLIKPNGVRISEFDVNFSLSDVQLNNWNTFFDIASNNFWNRVLSQYAILNVQEMQTDLQPYYTSTLLPYLNNMLAYTTMQDIINFFVDDAKVFNAVDCTVA